MYIETRRGAPNSLDISAYTFRETEWMALMDILDRCGISSEHSPLGADEFGREGRRYYVRTGEQIESLARVLQGHFGMAGRFEPDRGTGRTYACREVQRMGLGSGCEEFDASDDHAAIVKCGMIAGRRIWFGGESKQGTCSRPGFLGRLFR